MRTSIIVALAALGLTPAAPAAATVEDGHTIEVLGYDSRDGKIYYILDTNLQEMVWLPDVYFVRVSGPRAGKPVLVRSIKRGLDENDWLHEHEQFEERITRLRRRLRPLVRVRGSRRAVERALAFEARRVGLVRVTRDDPDEPAARCGRFSVSLTRGSASARVEVVECGAGEPFLIAAYPVPGTEATFAIVVSDPEPGDRLDYEHRPVLLTR